jgi:predicted phage-related endonuclease
MNRQIRPKIASPRYFIGGSDARIIMGDDETALIRLWREKRGEVEPEDLSGNLVVQLGVATEDLNRRWYESNSGHRRREMGRDHHPCRPTLSAPHCHGRAQVLALY